ncbi:MAG: AraC family transcriptional regulator [Pseudomonadota bacterium]
MGVVTSLFALKMVAAAGPGVDRRAILALAGLAADEPPDPKVMLADTVYYQMLEAMADHCDVTALPVKVGASMRCDEYGALGLAWKSAPTLLGSFRRVERYAQLWTSVVEYELQPCDGGMWFRLHRDGERRLGMRLSNEATLASAVSLSRQVSPGSFAPVEVHFQHPPPRQLDAHKSYFACPVHFGSDRDALKVSSGALALPNKLGDEGITRFLLSHLDTELDQIGSADSIEVLTQRAIARSLSDGVPKVADVARGLGMSARSFHRRLSEHGLTFQTLTETTRRDLAKELLSDDRHSLADVAFLTGFSEQSSFSRAFKRWVGHTPASFRKSANTS